MDEKAKKKYNDLHDKDQERYDRQVQELETKGYFILEDGSKSTDHAQKKFKYPKGTKMPVKAKESYTIYCEENMEKIMSKQSLSKVEAL